MKVLSILACVFCLASCGERKLKYEVRVLADANTYRNKGYYERADDEVKAGDSVGLWVGMSSEPGWTPVLLRNGHRGYIQTKFLSTTDTTKARR